MQDFGGFLLGVVIIGIVAMLFLSVVGMFAGEVMGTCDPNKIIYTSRISGSPIDECIYNANVFRQVLGE